MAPVKMAACPIDQPLRVGMISNTTSGRNRRRLQELREALAGTGVLHRETDCREAMNVAMDDLLSQRVGLLVINGGDGTLHATLTALLRRQPEQLPLLGVLSGGTTNMNALDVGLSGYPHRVVSRLLAWANAPKSTAIRWRPVLSVTPGGQATEYGMFLGAGAIVQGMHYCRERIHALGLRDSLAPGLTTLRALLGIARREPRFTTPETISVGLDGDPPHSAEWLLFMVSTLERLFLGLRPYWGSGDGPLHYSAMRAGAHRPLTTLPGLLYGRAGSATPARGYHSHHLRALHFWSQGEFALDGEFFDAREGVAVNATEPLAFVCP